MQVQVDYSISFFKSEKRLLKIKNFEFSLWKDEDNNKTVEDIKVHIKYIKVKEKDGLKLVLERTDERKLSPRILELREKIHNEEYLNNAIQRIAQVISKKLVENPEELKLRE